MEILRRKELSLVLSAQTGMTDHDVSHAHPRRRGGEVFGEARRFRYCRLFASGGPPSGRGRLCRRRRALPLGAAVGIAFLHTGKSRRSGPLRLFRPRGHALRRDFRGRREGPVGFGPGLPGAGARRLGLQAENAFQLKPGGEPPAVLQKSCKLRREAALVGRLLGAWAVAENGTAIRQKYLVARPIERPLCGERSACVIQSRIPAFGA